MEQRQSQDHSGLGEPVKLFGKSKPKTSPRKPQLIATIDFSRVNRFTGGTVRRILSEAFEKRAGKNADYLLIMALVDCKRITEFKKIKPGFYLASNTFNYEVLVAGNDFKKACLSNGPFGEGIWSDLIRTEAVINPKILDLYYRGTRRLMKVRKVSESGFQASTARGIRNFRWEYVEGVDYMSGADALRESILEIYHDGRRLSMKEK